MPILRTMVDYIPTLPRWTNLGVFPANVWDNIFDHCCAHSRFNLAYAGLSIAISRLANEDLALLAGNYVKLYRQWEISFGRDYALAAAKFLGDKEKISLQDYRKFAFDWRRYRGNCCFGMKNTHLDNKYISALLSYFISHKLIHDITTQTLTGIFESFVRHGSFDCAIELLRLNPKIKGLEFGNDMARKIMLPYRRDRKYLDLPNPTRRQDIAAVRENYRPCRSWPDNCSECVRSVMRRCSATVFENWAELRHKHPSLSLMVVLYMLRQFNEDVGWFLRVVIDSLGADEFVLLIHLLPAYLVDWHIEILTASNSANPRWYGNPISERAIAQYYHRNGIHKRLIKRLSK